METKNNIYDANKEYYNKVAEYRATSFLEGWEGEISKRRVLPAINVLDFKPADRWLDMGCASGFTLSLGLEKNKGILLDTQGIDIAENNIKLAAKRLKQYNTNLVLGNVEDLPFEDKWFDKITYLHVIEHVPNPVQSLKELRRVLKDDGEACFSFQNKYGLETFPLDISKKIVGYGTRARFGIGDPKGFNKGKYVLDTRRSIWEVKKMCKEAGLKLIRVDGCTVMLPSLAWRIPCLRKTTLYFSDIFQNVPIIKNFSSYINFKVVKENV